MVNLEILANQTEKEILDVYKNLIDNGVNQYIELSKQLEKKTLESIEKKQSEIGRNSLVENLILMPLNEKKKKETKQLLKTNFASTKAIAKSIGVIITGFEISVKEQIEKIDSGKISNDEINEILESFKAVSFFTDKTKILKDELELYKKNQNPKNALKVLKDTEFSVGLSFVDGVLTSSKEIVAAAKKIADSGQNLQIVIKNNFKNERIKDGKTPYIFSSEEMKQIVELKKDLDKAGIKQLFFSEYDQTTYGMWEFKDVIKANAEIEDVAKKIKSMKLSPLEAMICVHQYAANFVYDDGVRADQSTDFGKQLHIIKQVAQSESSRTVVGAIANKHIVCVGYSRLVKSLCDKLEMPGLRAGLNACMIADLNKPLSIGSNHAQNIIEIDDKKYGVKGKFREDACWDSKRVLIENSTTDVTYANFLTSLKDISHLKGFWYLKDSNEDITNVDYDTFNRSKTPKKIKEKAKTFLKQKSQTKNEFLESQEAIPIETFKKALKQVYLKTEVPSDEVDQKVEDAVKKSAAIARKIFNNRSKNPFKIFGEEKKLKTEELYKVGAVINNEQRN